MSGNRPPNPPWLSWPRLRFTLATSLLLGALVDLSWTSGIDTVLIRTVTLGLLALFVFTLFERWPTRLPQWLGRWVLQVLATALVVPLGALLFYVLSTAPGAPPFWREGDRLAGFLELSILGVMVAPWAALTAVVRRQGALVRQQALAFELERSELQRQALDARLQLLQAQVTPHFLFNTLANVQALVETGSSRAPALLGSLIAYLRAAVPRMDEPATTIAGEMALVRAYLELMHMRMPDRLSFSLHADESALALRCPSMMLMTLVENAVRHGIDPAEDGGCIELRVERINKRCVAIVSDTGVGLGAGGAGLGTGLATLRERLQLMFGGDAVLEVSASSPHGVCAEVRFPAREERAA